MWCVCLLSSWSPLCTWATVTVAHLPPTCPAQSQLGSRLPSEGAGARFIFDALILCVSPPLRQISVHSSPLVGLCYGLPHCISFIRPTATRLTSNERKSLTPRCSFALYVRGSRSLLAFKKLREIFRESLRGGRKGVHLWGRDKEHDDDIGMRYIYVPSWPKDFHGWR
jgi:hypothetical protein